MPRAKEFEPREALEKAMEVFWLRGYEATSLRELLEAMGIGRGSFYDTFGDKRALFLAALERFEESRTAWILSTLDTAEPATEGVREVFERTVRNLTSSEPRRGCLLANSAVELAPHDPEVSGRVLGHLRRTAEAFERALLRARENGELPESADPKALSRFLVTHLHGLRVTARAGVDREVLEDAARAALSVLR